MPSCCLLPCPSAELPLCFLLLPLLRLPALCVLYDPLHLLRAESPFDPLKVGNCPPQGLVLQLHLLQAFGQVAQRLTKRPYRHCCRQGRFGYDFLLPLDKSYYMGVYSLCFHRQNIRNFVNVSSVIFGC